MKNAAQRQADLRERRAKAGLKQCVVYAPIEHHALVKRFAARLVQRKQISRPPPVEAD